jgi:hypothetical protein
MKRKEISKIRKEFYRRLLYIALGIIPMILLWYQKGPERYIALAGFIFSAIQVLVIVGTSKDIVDDFFPPKTYNETTTKPFDSFMVYFAITLFFLGLFFELFEIKIIDNTLGGSALFWKSAFVGIFIAIILTIILKLTKSTVFDESDRRFSVYFGLFIGFFLFIPALASFINHTFSDNKIDCQTYQIARKSLGGKRDETSWLFLHMNNNSIERFEVNRNFYERVYEGGEIKLCTKKGKLGYDFVVKFETLDE